MKYPHRWIALFAIVAFGMAGYTAIRAALGIVNAWPARTGFVIEMDSAAEPFLKTGALDATLLAQELKLQPWPDTKGVLEVPFVRPTIARRKGLTRTLHSRSEYDLNVIARFNDALTKEAFALRDRHDQEMRRLLLNIAGVWLLLAGGLAVVGWRVRPIRENEFP